MKKLPQRTCIGCSTKQNKQDLIRIVKNKDGQIHVDPSGKMEGRGTYICKKAECLEKAVKSKRILKYFELKIGDDTYENLKKIIIGGEVVWVR